MKKRYIIEGTWSGYRSSQSRVCHRTVTTRPDQYKGLHTVAFTDGTTMNITLRPCMLRERVKEIHGYDSLLDKIVNAGLCDKGYVSVMDVNND